MFKQGSHPINLAVRFILEMTALIMVGIWGFSIYNGLQSYILGIGLPVLMATVWGVFAVPNDPSRSGKTVVETKGVIRLLLEFSFFILGSYVLYDLNYSNIFFGYSITVIIHYLLSIDRIKWLLNQ